MHGGLSLQLQVPPDLKARHRLILFPKKRKIPLHTLLTVDLSIQLQEQESSNRHYYLPVFLFLYRAA